MGAGRTRRRRGRVDRQRRRGPRRHRQPGRGLARPAPARRRAAVERGGRPHAGTVESPAGAGRPRHRARIIWIRRRARGPAQRLPQSRAAGQRPLCRRHRRALFIPWTEAHRRHLRHRHHGGRHRCGRRFFGRDDLAGTGPDGRLPGPQHGPAAPGKAKAPPCPRALPTTPTTPSWPAASTPRRAPSNGPAPSWAPISACCRAARRATWRRRWRCPIA